MMRTFAQYTFDIDTHNTQVQNHASPEHQNLMKPPSRQTIAVEQTHVTLVCTVPSLAARIRFP